MESFWTNESVLAFAGSEDPVKAIENAARRAVFDAVEEGWGGPPFDPFELARIREIEVVPRNELREARTVAVRGGLAIEYNPTRSRDRVRFSIAHEIAHTLFGDVSREPRYRHNPSAGPVDGWQLEMLCNIAAAEILMPTEVLGELTRRAMKIEEILDLRAAFGVSTEALLRRATKLANRPVAMFAASRTAPDSLESSFRIDYTVPSLIWEPKFDRGTTLTEGSVLAECTAVGYTARAEETWPKEDGALSIQAVGTPPYPGQTLPRVLGLLSPKGQARERGPRFDERHGDATRPAGGAERMIVHLVNDQTANWGGQFARALKERYPKSQDDFRSWVAGDSANLRLGAVRVTRVDPSTRVASVVAQKGYGRSNRARIRYEALRAALAKVAEQARKSGEAVHMPRIGAGQAGGRWAVIREIVEETLLVAGVAVTVYVPPNQAIGFERDPYTELRLDV